MGPLKEIRIEVNEICNMFMVIIILIAHADSDVIPFGILTNPPISPISMAFKP